MEDIFEQLQDNTRSLWQNPQASVRRLRRMPSATIFFREYVATSTPVIIEGGVSGWKAAQSWDLESLTRANPDLEVTVDCTPNGRGDCIVECSDLVEACGTGGDTDSSAVFVKPEERRMKFQSFVDKLLSKKNCNGGCGDPECTGSSCGGVPYLSHQNDSLRNEFPELMADVEPCLDVAREAFGNEPDAVNLWIGDDRSITSVHKDHYENMYCVLRGQKQFTLLPPSDVLFLYEQEYPQGRYQQKADGSGFEVESEEGTVPWISVDPVFPDLERHPLFRYASPVQCSVGPGDILYLPALWYHRVSQKGITIAVNYWHDMQFDFKYVYYRFLQDLARKHQLESSRTASPCIGHLGLTPPSVNLHSTHEASSTGDADVEESMRSR